MNRLPLEIGGITFPTKADALRHARRVLHEAPLGELDLEHVRFVFGLLRLHPRTAEKLGCGLHRFEIGIEPRWGTRCFWLVRKDGTRTDFSIKECLSPSTTRAQARAAFRAEVASQSIRFRYEHGAGRWPLVCPITGEEFLEAECEVDHHPVPFAEILRAFLTVEGITEDEVRVEHSDGQTYDTLKDRLLARKWQDFHREHARLRLLSAEGHRIHTTQSQRTA